MGLPKLDYYEEFEDDEDMPDDPPQYKDLGLSPPHKYENPQFSHS